MIIPRRCLGEHCEGRSRVSERLRRTVTSALALGTPTFGKRIEAHLSLVERSKHGESSNTVTGDEATSEHLSPLSHRRELNSDSDEEDNEAVCDV